MIGNSQAMRAGYERMLLPAFLPLVLVIFTASGFSGLIYQSIWSHYIKLFLGHAAYAQTLVLAIFMGGMALGAWLASRFSPRWRDLLLAYAVTEAVIGAMSLVFHPVFLAATGFALDTALPNLPAAAITPFKWSLAALLILPQSILLGMTFPLMTGGVLRVEPRRSGYAIAMLYFTNSLGAAFGVLASGFYFIGAVGLPGTLVAAAIINLAVAGAAMLLPRSQQHPAQVTEASRAPTAVPQLRLLLWVAALTGMSSFMYEVGWIRMLSLVLGSSTHAFELMLAAFIFGIAFGGLWVRRRIDSAPDTVRLLGWVQVVMGIAAIATLPVYGETFRLMQGAMAMLRPTEAGYVAFNLVSHGLALLVMFPAAFCAGMTLPLITASLLRRGSGERAIGQVYAANTAGAIAGVALAVHLAMPLVGLKGLIIVAAAVDLALGVILLRPAGLPWAKARSAGFAAGASMAVVLFATFAVQLDAHRMASGVFRHGDLLDKEDEVLSHEDGKTATVSVTRTSTGLSLRTNGKPDAAIRTAGGLSSDEPTMVLLGALPLLHAPEARRIANIGFGSGITTHVLLASPAVESVDTVEIEPAIVRAASHFKPYNARALSDPRSRIHYEDARTFFAARRMRYDVIVSEPSNPWVSGVASLYTTEFYRDVRRYLREGGLFVQWIHLYEISPVLVATVLEAMRPHFADYMLWLSNESDLIIVAANGGQVRMPDARMLAHGDLAKELERIHVRNLDDLALHRLGSRRTFQPYFAQYAAPPNSDFDPLLDQRAVKDRFLRRSANEIGTIVAATVPVLELLDAGVGARASPAAMSIDQRPWRSLEGFVKRAAGAAHYLVHGSDAALQLVPPALVNDAVVLRAALIECRVAPAPTALRQALVSMGELINSHLPAAETARLWRRVNSSTCLKVASAEEQRIIELYIAVSTGQASNMVALSRGLLEAERQPEPKLASYAVAALMTGHLLRNDRGAAMRAFNEHRGKLARTRDWQPVFRLLVAHAVDG
jgi:spermidine synthase